MHDLIKGETKEETGQYHSELGGFTGMNRITVYPNPFMTKVNFLLELEAEALCSIVLYNSLGAKVAVLNEKQLSEGNHLLPFDGSHLAPGIYHCVAKIGQQQQVLRVAIVR